MKINEDLEPPTLRLKYFHWGPSILVIVLCIISMILVINAQNTYWFHSSGLCSFDWYLEHTEALCLGFIPLNIPYGPYQAEVQGSKLDVERCDIMGKGIRALLIFIVCLSAFLIPNQFASYFLYQKKYYKLVWLSQILSFASSILILFLYLGAFIWSDQCPSSISEYEDITGTFVDGPGYSQAIAAGILHCFVFIISILTPCFIWVCYPQKPSRKDVDNKIRLTLSTDSRYSIGNISTSNDSNDTIGCDDTDSVDLNSTEIKIKRRGSAPGLKIKLNRKSHGRRSKSPVRQLKDKNQLTSPYIKKKPNPITLDS